MISTSKVKSIGQCLVACSQDQRCQSINFKFLGSICELSDADRETKPEDYKLNDGYAYSDYFIKVRVNINLYDAVFLTKIFEEKNSYCNSKCQET